MEIGELFEMKFTLICDCGHRITNEDEFWVHYNERQRYNTMIEHPQECYCENPVFGELIRQAKIFQFLTGGELEYPVYRCRQCGKERIDAPLMAS